MPKTSQDQCLEDAFDLYLKYKGERFDLIERDMRLKGWSFNKQCLKNRGKGLHFRQGWIEKYQWAKTLAIYLTAKDKTILTAGQKLLQEVEIVREQIFNHIQASGVSNRDLVWQHDKYVQRSAEILAQIETAANPLRDFAAFWKFLVTTSLTISPSLARELVNAEEAVIKRARDEFGKC